MPDKPDKWAQYAQPTEDKWAQYAAAPNAGLAPPDASATTGKLPNGGDTGEGPIAQGLTTMETRLSEMPGAVVDSLKEGWKNRNAPVGQQMRAFGSAINPANLIDTKEGSVPMNIGGTAANLLPFAVDPAGGGIGESALGRMSAAIPRDTLGQAARTAGKTLVNENLTQPFKTFGRIPDYWRESSPEGRMLAETKRAVGERRASMIPTRISNPGASAPLPLGTMRSVAPSEETTFIPEPRGSFAGENEGYMASTPREDLLGLARMRKPGAGAQLQQLGKPIIYIPKEADLP